MRAAFYESDITPPLGCFMTGHYSKLLSEDVFEKIYAKALVVESDGEIAAIVCVDVCMLPVGIHEKVTKRVYEYTGIESNRICITCNHTHKGAPVSDSPEINCFADDAYTDVFMRLVADTIILAFKRLKDGVEISFGKENVPGIAFCRNFVTKEGKYISWGVGRDDLVGTLGEVNDELVVLTFYSDGKPFGAVVNFALHQDSAQGAIGYTGDYSSIISQKLKESYGQNFVSLFLLGTCGDINHVDIHNPDTLTPFYHRTIGNILYEHINKLIFGASQRIDGSVMAVKEEIQIEKRIADNEYTINKTIELLQNGGKIMQARNLIFYNATNEDKYAKLYIQCIKIGDLCIYALPGEIYTKIGNDIKQASTFDKNVVVENCNTYCGYIPTKNAFDECSELYESMLCNHSCLVAEACDIITQKALELSKKL